MYREPGPQSVGLISWGLPIESACDHFQCVQCPNNGIRHPIPTNSDQWQTTCMKLPCVVINEKYPSVCVNPLLPTLGQGTEVILVPSAKNYFGNWSRCEERWVNLLGTLLWLGRGEGRLFRGSTQVVWNVQCQKPTHQCNPPSCQGGWWRRLSHWAPPALSSRTEGLQWCQFISLVQQNFAPSRLKTCSPSRFKFAGAGLEGLLLPLPPPPPPPLLPPPAWPPVSGTSLSLVVLNKMRMTTMVTRLMLEK